MICTYTVIDVWWDRESATPLAIEPGVGTLPDTAANKGDAFHWEDRGVGVAGIPLFKHRTPN